MNLRNRAFIILETILLSTCACSATTSRQDPEKAAASAIVFARAAVMDGDLDKAYSLLDDDVRANASKERFVEAMRKTVLGKRPDSLTAIEFEPVPGEDEVNIYLIGESSDGNLHYRIPMRGNSTDGYKPMGILRGTYKSNSLRQPLTKNQSTKDH
jgi:hypothetical protein